MGTMFSEPAKKYKLMLLEEKEEEGEEQEKGKEGRNGTVRWEGEGKREGSIHGRGCARW